MKIKYLYLAAVNIKGEVVGVVIEAGQQSNLIPVSKFGPYDRLAMYSCVDALSAECAAQYYTADFWREVHGAGSAAVYQKTRRDAISPKSWTVEVRSAEISL